MRNSKYCMKFLRICNWIKTDFDVYDTIDYDHERVETPPENDLFLNIVHRTKLFNHRRKKKEFLSKLLGIKTV